MTRRVRTENPQADQWRILAQYSYEPNIRRYLASRGHTSPTSADIEYIAGSLRQGEAYFRAVQTAPLDISPLLAYYGAVNLLSGTVAMLLGSRPEIKKSHGMELVQPLVGPRIADVQVRPLSGKGALPVLAGILDPGSPPVAGVPWSMEEILASIPDVKTEFVACFPTIPPLTLAVEIFKAEGITAERIPLTEFGQGVDPAARLAQIPNFTSAYLRPQFVHNNAVLRYKLGADQIGTYSISGQKYLQIGLTKSRRTIAPNQEVLMLMGLFALGFLSRYQPDHWNPFVQRDDTGERLVIEKFLAVALRYLPNLAVNAILGDRLQFVYEAERDPGSVIVATDADLKRRIRDEALAVFRELKP